MKTLIEWMDTEEKPFQILASTGRAAKILSNKTECPALTVHSCIYTFDDFNQDIEKVVKKLMRQKVLTKQDNYYYSLSQYPQIILITIGNFILLMSLQ